MAQFRGRRNRVAHAGSPQVAAEARSVAVIRLKIDAEDAAKARLLPWCTAPYGAEEVRRALALVNRWRLSWWGGLIVGGSAQPSRHRRSAPVIEGLRFIDPFATAPEELLT